MDKNIITIILVFLVISVYCWFIKTKRSVSSPNVEEIEMEDIFLQEVQNGNKGCRIAYVYSLADLVILKSLFQSEQIPFFCEFEHLSKIKTGLPIIQINNVIFNVLEKDVNDSKYILQEYEKNKQIDKSYKSKIRNIFEFILIGNAISSAKDNSIQILI